VNKTQIHSEERIRNSLQTNGRICKAKS